MTPDEIADSLNVASLTVQLAVGAAVEELRALPADDPKRGALKLAMSTAYGRMRGTYGKLVTEPREYPTDLCEDEGCPNAGTPHVCVTSPNVVTLPVKQATRWTVIKHLDGRKFAASHDFGVSGAWAWIVDTVAHEHGLSEAAADERISSIEGCEEQFDGDDVVTIDGLPVYRIEHTSKPFSK